eukprot:TRINITY_DN26053_c0_g1_i5.p1 TRINITY_DN26053_c0_g1~~TRINITY_DN26053_c0_g1_i5.p1  ORF type:complete len:315 (+),score=36.01 TRINITY_DN26053_c0_g1_i5:83-1027(+)
MPQRGAAASVPVAPQQRQAEPGVCAYLERIDRARTEYIAQRVRVRTDELEERFGPWLATMERRRWQPPPAFSPVCWPPQRDWWPCPARQPEFAGFQEATAIGVPPEEAIADHQWGKVTIRTWGSVFDRHMQLLMQAKGLRKGSSTSALDSIRHSVHPVPLAHELVLVHKSFHLGDADGVEMGSQIIPLLCPYTQRRMELPARGAQCRHLHVFDLCSWAEMVLGRSTTAPSLWSCPHCSEHILLGQIYVSPWFAAVLAKLPQSCESVEVRPDGSFAVPVPVAPRSQSREPSASAKRPRLEGSPSGAPGPPEIVID